MAIILDRPDKNNDLSKTTFEFNEGRIIIETKDGNPLNAYQCIAVLEGAKAMILKDWLN